MWQRNENGWWSSEHGDLTMDGRSGWYYYPKTGNRYGPWMPVSRAQTFADKIAAGETLPERAKKSRKKTESHKPSRNHPWRAFRTLSDEVVKCASEDRCKPK